MCRNKTDYIDQTPNRPKRGVQRFELELLSCGLTAGRISGSFTLEEDKPVSMGRPSLSLSLSPSLSLSL